MIEPVAPDASGVGPAQTGEFRLAGVFSVLPTAFHEDGSLDMDGTRAIVGATIDAGVAGLTVLGVMGEAAELDDDERRRVVSAVADSGIAMIVGVTGESHQVLAERARDA